MKIYNIDKELFLTLRKNQELIINLNKENAKANIEQIFHGKENEIFKGKVTINHNANNTHSKIITRIALDNKSQAFSLSKININNYKGCTGMQKETTLLLSKEAKIFSRPSLEINNNDVECSHSVSISNINKEELFYLMTRGLSETKARNLILEGFLKEVKK